MTDKLRNVFSAARVSLLIFFAPKILTMIDAILSVVVLELSTSATCFSSSETTRGGSTEVAADPVVSGGEELVLELKGVGAATKVS